MKYIKKFNEVKELSIEDWCEKFELEDYSINEDNTVDVDANINLYGKNLERIPIQFGIAAGSFNCNSNSLSSLKGSPNKVKNGFYCSRNMLTTLEHSPSEVYNNFQCFENKLTTLEGCTKILSEGFICSDNKLQTLVGGPEKVARYYDCSNNYLISTDGLCEGIYMLRINNNPIYEVYKLFHDDYKAYKDSLDYNYLRGTNIIKLRFGEALEEAGIREVPNSIPGYKYI